MWTTKDMPQQTGKTIIVTGANTGIGYETALALYKAGAQVILAARDLQKAQEAMQQIQEQPGNGSLEMAELDLASLDSVHRFAVSFKARHQRLDVLINNAGVMIPPNSKTVEGFELQFGVNFIGHFLLTGLLYPLLQATPGARVVTVSSNAYLNGKIDFDNLYLEKDYDPIREYGQSKLANILFAVELHRRIGAKGNKVLSIAAQPGANRTELARHMSTEAFTAAIQRIGALMEPWQGALPSLYAATDAHAKGGALYGPDQDGGFRGYPAEAPLEPHALDASTAARLWDLAEEATGVRYP